MPPDPDWERRQRLLRQSEEQGDVATLVAGLRDPDHRLEVAGRVAALGITEAIPALMLLLDAHDPYARLAAIRALTALRVPQAADRLTEIAGSDEIDWVRSWALGSLSELACTGVIGPEAVLPLLERSLRSDSWKVRASAAHGLGQLGDDRAGELLAGARASERGIKNRYLTGKAYRRAMRDWAARRSAGTSLRELCRRALQSRSGSAIVTAATFVLTAYALQALGAPQWASLLAAVAPAWLAYVCVRWRTVRSQVLTLRRERFARAASRSPRGK